MDSNLAETAASSGFNLCLESGCDYILLPMRASRFAGNLYPHDGSSLNYKSLVIVVKRFSGTFFRLQILCFALSTPFSSAHKMVLCHSVCRCRSTCLFPLHGCRASTFSRAFGLCRRVGG